MGYAEWDAEIDNMSEQAEFAIWLSGVVDGAFLAGYAEALENVVEEEEEED